MQGKIFMVGDAPGGFAAAAWDYLTNKNRSPVISAISKKCDDKSLSFDVLNQMYPNIKTEYVDIITDKMPTHFDG